MKEYTVTSEFEGMRLDRYVKKACPELGKATIQKLFRKGDIKINEKKCAADTVIKSGDKIKVYAIISGEKPDISINENLAPLDIIYEDDFLLAVNKPPFLESQPSEKGADSVTERLKYYLKDAIAEYGGMFLPGIVNRLDTNTSGIILAGKTPTAQRSLNEAMAKNKIDKKYYALVKGVFKKTVKATHYAVKDREKNIMKLYDEPVETAVNMVSVFEPVKTYGDYTLLSVKLITGRTHQIRAQLAYMGYPVVMDKKYGDKYTNDNFEKNYNLKRQFLHCYEMNLTLWYDYSTLKITADLPEDLKKVCDLLEGK